MKRLLICIIPLLFCLSCDLPAQFTLNQGGTSNGYFCEEIPFEYEYGKILIKVKIGGQVRKFAFDTGAPLAVTKVLTSEMNVTELGNEAFTDAAENVIDLDLVRINHFRIGNIDFRDIPAVVLNLNDFDFASCMGISGFIGSNAVRNCIVQIDMNRKILLLTNDIECLDLSNTYPMELGVNELQSMPSVVISLDMEIGYWVEFDTGSPNLVEISAEMAEENLGKGTAEVIRTGSGKENYSLTAEKNAQRRLIRFDSMYLGGAKFSAFESVVINGKQDSRIGLGLAEYGILTLDYPGNTFYFEPYVDVPVTKVLPSKPRLGFNFFPDRDHYTIGAVWEGSAAWEAGLRTGLRVMQINGTDFSQRNASLDCLLMKLSLYEGDEVTIKYLSEVGETRRVMIK